VGSSELASPVLGTGVVFTIPWQYIFPVMMVDSP
jgi:hypothetical protein